MRIAVPIETKNGMESMLYGHFGSAPHYAVYDTQTEALSYIDNDHSTHEHGHCSPTRGLADEKVEAVVCQGMGMRAIQNLGAMGIAVYFAENIDNVASAVLALKDSQLAPMSAENACGHHHGEGHDCH